SRCSSPLTNRGESSVESTSAIFVYSPMITPRPAVSSPYSTSEAPRRRIARSTAGMRCSGQSREWVARSSSMSAACGAYSSTSSRGRCGSGVWAAVRRRRSWSTSRTWARLASASKSTSIARIRSRDRPCRRSAGAGIVRSNSTSAPSRVGWGRPVARGAGRSPPRAGPLSSDTVLVLSRGGADADLVPRVDEQRDLDLAAGLQAGGLGAAAGAIALQARLGLLDGEHAVGGQLDDERLALVERDHDVLVLRQEVLRVTDDLRGEAGLLPGGRVHEHVHVRVEVGELHVAAVDGRGLDLHAGVEGLVHALPGQHVLELGPHEGRSLAGLDVLELDHAPELLVQHQDHPVLQIVRRRHGSPRLSSWRSKDTARELCGPASARSSAGRREVD